MVVESQIERIVDVAARNKLEARFFKLVLIGDGCWEWSGWTYTNGYGQFVINWRKLLAHRVSW